VLEGIGQEQLFAEPTGYVGPQTGWIILAATDPNDAIAPTVERDALLRLVRAGIDFPGTSLRTSFPPAARCAPLASPFVSTMGPWAPAVTSRDE
jgi:hypothetical protein